MKKLTSKMVKAIKAESKIEEQMWRRTMDYVKKLPPLPPGWTYDFVPSEIHYNPDTDSYEGTIKAVPRQIISIKED